MSETFDNTIKKLEAVKRYLKDDAKTVMGVEALNHYKQSFKNQGFTDTSLKKWEEVERRKPTSPWRGFHYGATSTRPGTKRRKEGSTSNYSPAAEQRPILSGTTQDLMNSLTWERTASGIRVVAQSAYAKIHNEGGPMKVFGKHPAKMPKRQFMGKSKKLTERIQSILLRDIKNILK
jgi:phage gpG-like protein